MASVTPKKAIAQFCKECVCDNNEEIRNCTADGVESRHKCPLYDFRPYKSTAAKSAGKSTEKVARGQKVMTEAHKAKMKAGKAASKAAKLAAGLPASTRAKAVPKAKISTKKAVEASARMTPEHKLKMKAGKLNKRIAAGYKPTSEEALILVAASRIPSKVKPAKVAKTVKGAKGKK